MTKIDITGSIFGYYHKGCPDELVAVMLDKPWDSPMGHLKLAWFTMEELQNV